VSREWKFVIRQAYSCTKKNGMKCHGEWLEVIPTSMVTCTSSSEADGSIDCDTSKHVC